MEEEKKIEQYTPFTHEEFYKRYYVHRVAASSVILRNKKILLVKEIRRGKYNWGLPGGLLEHGESIIAGLIREVQEETNITIKPYGLLGLNNWAGKSIFENDPYNHSGFLFILASDYVHGDPKPDGSEVFEVNFFDIDEFSSLKVHPSIKAYYDSVLAGSFLPLQSADFKNENTYRYMFSKT